MSKFKAQTTQRLQQRQISQQQIRLLELLQLSGGELQGRIEDELEENPALEEDEDASSTEEDEWASHYRGRSSSNEPEDTNYEQRISSPVSLQERLFSQLGFLSLSREAQQIGEQIIGSLDEDGYLRRPLQAIAIDLRKMGLKVGAEEVKDVLEKIHSFEPAGIAARDLRECLLLQLLQLPEQQAAADARRIIQEQYDSFTKKHFSQIAKRLHLSESDMRAALQLIMQLNPKPGETTSLLSLLLLHNCPTLYFFAQRIS